MTHLTEHISDWHNDTLVERSTRTIKNVALAGPESKNGYRYAESALKAAVPLYETVPVFLDHPTAVQRPRDRSTRDLAGSVANVRYEAGRLRGDLRTLDTEAGRTLLALAEADHPAVGMSHVVLAEKSADGTLVERIVEVVSVDAVVFPATTKTFRESNAATSEAGDAANEEMNASFPTGQPDRAERPASSSAIEPSAPTCGVSMSGSLERLLASVDAELPRHLRRLAAAAGNAAIGRGARVGVFPRHVVVECRTAPGTTEHFALAWHWDKALVFGDELVPLTRLNERLGSWDAVTTPNEEMNDDIYARLEQIEERLRTLTARPAAIDRPPTSTLRRRVAPDRVSDELFVRTVRRR